MIKKTIYVTLIIAISTFIYFYFFKENKIKNISYEFTKIEKGNIKKIVSATGTIVPTSEIVLSSEISGKIVDIFKDYNELNFRNILSKTSKIESEKMVSASGRKIFEYSKI